jgi:hypothetical protein
VILDSGCAGCLREWKVRRISIAGTLGADYIAWLQAGHER